MEARPNFDSMPTKALLGAVAARARAAADAAVMMLALFSVSGNLSCRGEVGVGGGRGGGSWLVDRSW